MYFAFFSLIWSTVMSDLFEWLLNFKYSGVLFNTLTVIVGSLIGIAFKKGIPKKITDALMLGLGLCVVYIGISGAVGAGSDSEANPIIPVIAVALGAVIGTACDIDGILCRAGAAVERRFSKSGSSDGKIAEGFVSAALMFCVGSMTIVGGINAGVSGDNTLYFTKGVLDFVSGMALAVSYGVGVLLSSAFVLLFQGGIVLAAGVIEPLLTEHMICEMNCTGSLLIVMIGLNLMNITKIKVANYLPAILAAMLLAIVI